MELILVHNKLEITNGLFLDEKKEDEDNFKKPTRRKKSEKTGVILLTEFQNDSKIRSQTISKQKLNQFVEDKNSLIQIERSTIIKENLLK